MGSTAARPPQLSLPSWLQTARFFRDPESLISRATEECGDLFALRLLGFGEWVFVSSPTLVRALFRAPQDTLVAGEINHRMLGFMLGRQSLFSLDGDAHRNRQKLLHPHLVGRASEERVAILRDLAEAMIARWPRDRPFTLLPHVQRYALEAIVSVLLPNLAPETRDQLVDRFLDFALQGLRSPLIGLPFLQRDLGAWSPWGRVLRLRAAVFEVFGEAIDALIESVDRSDAEQGALAALARATAELPAAERRDAVLHETLNLLNAGFETTGNLTAWCFASLLEYPEATERVRQEIDEVIGDGPIEAHHLDALPYLEAVMNESLRFRPLAPMAGVRLVKKPFTLGGYALREGSLVSQCFTAMCRRPELFANPTRFDPDHFFERKHEPFAWNPFGGGTRRCIGRDLALIEMRVVLVTALRQAPLRLAQPSVQAVRQGFFFAPKHGLRVARV